MHTNISSHLGVPKMYINQMNDNSLEYKYKMQALQQLNNKNNNN